MTLERLHQNSAPGTATRPFVFWGTECKFSVLARHGDGSEALSILCNRNLGAVPGLSALRGASHRFAQSPQRQQWQPEREWGLDRQTSLGQSKGQLSVQIAV